VYCDTIDNASSGIVRYGNYTNETWQKGVVDKKGSCWNVIIDADDDGNTHIVYIDINSKNIVHYDWDGKKYSKHTVYDRKADSVGFCAFNGEPIVVYSCNNSSEIWYAQYDNGEWSRHIFRKNSGGDIPMIVLDVTKNSNGKAYIFYLDDQGGLVYESIDESNGSRYIIDKVKNEYCLKRKQEVKVMIEGQCIIDDTGRSNLLYYAPLSEKSKYELRYALCSGRLIKKKVIDNASIIKMYMCTDYAGKLNIIYTYTNDIGYKPRFKREGGTICMVKD
jgi:hypothetical protein